MTHARTTLPNEEREVDPSAAAKVKALLAKDEDVDLIDGQDDAAHKARGANPSDAPPVSHKPRKERSDKGKPKLVKPVAATLEVASKRIYALSERVAKAAAKIGTAKAEFEAAKTELQSYMDGL